MFSAHAHRSTTFSMFNSSFLKILLSVLKTNGADLRLWCLTSASFGRPLFKTISAFSFKDSDLGIPRWLHVLALYLSFDKFVLLFDGFFWRAHSIWTMIVLVTGRVTSNKFPWFIKVGHDILLSSTALSCSPRTEIQRSNASDAQDCEGAGDCLAISVLTKSLISRNTMGYRCLFARSLVWRTGWVFWGFLNFSNLTAAFLHRLFL